MQPIQLSIPTACHEDWDKMTPNQQGRFCGSCAKTVIDFSAMTDTQLIGYFENLKNENICGRVYPDQLDRPIEKAAAIQPRKKIYWLWQYAAALVLFFTKGFQAKAQGEIKVKKDSTDKVYNRTDMPVRMGGLQRIQYPENVHVIKAAISQLFILDENNNPIVGASVQLFPQEKLMLTDSAGRINLGKNHSITQVKVTAVGYEAQDVIMKDIKGNSISLVKNMVTLDEVVVQGDGTIRGKMIIAGGISVQRVNNIIDPVPVISPLHSIETVFSVFPNPVQKGKEISFTLTAKDNKTYKVFVSDANGKMLLQQTIVATNKAQQKILHVPAAWSGGMYILSMANMQGEIVQSEKIMLL